MLLIGICGSIPDLSTFVHVHLCIKVFFYHHN